MICQLLRGINPRSLSLALQPMTQRYVAASETYGLLTEALRAEAPSDRICNRRIQP
jgi:hypothetical protein